ncbi:ATP-dependent helicase HrpB [Gemmatimonas sp.]|uniref:ATP-dependent helicase HrpB n=1 Tax=Gemmatimonas sp. TaxID=1962908 RepID=UPI0027BB04BD|nr:ATP-dependent helicase HrpB [Gemmatimonas sp.]
MTPTLPIDDALPALREALRARAVAVLEAPPGAGKTTRVPLALLQEPWLERQKLVMLEPRRLAARAAAHFMAKQLGEQVGGTVGYRVRGETRVSRQTRIEVVTEGVLARLLSADATLDGYGAVVFDEFHERSLHADLGLALVLDTQQVRDDLRVLVMSATLDGDAVARLIADTHGAAPVVRSSGRMFPIETHYRPPRADERLEIATSRVVREALEVNDGDVLVFLPGMGEQRRVEERLGGAVPAHVRVHVLHGTMPLADQDAALAAAPAGMRKVVLSTSVAETSLTVEGVRVVVDAGQSRVPRYDATAGLTRLHTVRVSRASADQRRGRAGRVAPGACYRLWDVHEEHGFLASTRPEIIDADLSSLALELADAGIADPLQLRWLDAPRPSAFAQARTLLAQLGALSADAPTGRITAHGKRMAALPLAPRLAHLLLVAAERGQLELGASIAALLEERDVLRGEGFVRAPADLRLRTELLHGDRDSVAAYGARADRDGVRRVRQNAGELVKRVNSGSSTSGSSERGHWDDADVGTLLALAFPDRVAQRRAGSEGRYLLRNGSGAALPKGDSLFDEPYLAVAELEGQPPEYRIVRAAPLSLDDVRADFGGQLVRASLVAWDERSRSVKAVERTTLGAITLEEKPQRDPDADAVRAALLAQLPRVGAGAWPWREGALRLRERLAFAHRHDAMTWPDVSDTALVHTLAEWLGPHLDGVRTWAQFEQVDWYEALFSLVPWAQRAAVERLAPTHIEVPSGSRIAIDYGDPAAPVLAVKLQEVFGWTTTPTVFDGRVPLTLHLLSPAQRPVQVTRDLAGFWKHSYFEVRKELRGRYPRHPWPDDPLTAEATRRAKPRGT